MHEIDQSIKLFIFAGGCVNDFTSHQMTHSRGGDQVPEVDQIEACLQACRDDPQCLAVDFNMEFFRCFIHVEGYLDRLRFDVDDINQYRKIPCGKRSTGIYIAHTATSMWY